MKKIICFLILSACLTNTLLSAQNKPTVEPIRKIAVISLLDDTMCVTKPEKGFLTTKNLLKKRPFEEGIYLNQIIENEMNQCLNDSFDIVSANDLSKNLHQSKFTGLDKFLKIKSNCNQLYQFINDSKVDAIVFVHRS